MNKYRFYAVLGEFEIFTADRMLLNMLELKGCRTTYERKVMLALPSLNETLS
jgi:hypothetical protein